MNITTSEQALITKLANSNYQGGDDRGYTFGATLWASMEIQSKSEGGVLASLIQKGLAGFQDNGNKDENYVWLTLEGSNEYLKMIGEL
jgi:hypothetical protein